MINLLLIPTLRMTTLMPHPRLLIILLPSLGRRHSRHFHRPRININTPRLPNSLCINLLRLNNEHCIRKRFLALSARQFVREDLDFDTKDTLAEQDVSCCTVNEVADGLAGMNHETVGEFHGFGAGSPEFARDDDFAALGTGFHDEAENTITSTKISLNVQDHNNTKRTTAEGRKCGMVPSHCQTRQKLITQTLTLCNSTQSTLLNLLSVQLDRPLTKLESFLHKSSQFPDSAALVAEDFLGVGGTDDDFCPGRGDADFTARIALFGKFTGEEFVEFGEEDAIGDELQSAAGPA